MYIANVFTGQGYWVRKKAREVNISTEMDLIKDVADQLSKIREKNPWSAVSHNNVVTKEGPLAIIQAKLEGEYLTIVNPRKMFKSPPHLTQEACGSLGDEKFYVARAEAFVTHGYIVELSDYTHINFPQMDLKCQIFFMNLIICWGN